MSDLWDRRGATGGTELTAGQTDGSDVRLALESSSALNAQKAARISQLAQSLGLPENLI